MLTPITQLQPVRPQDSWIRLQNVDQRLLLIPARWSRPPKKSATRYFHHFAETAQQRPAALQPFRIPRLRQQLIRLRLSFTPARDERPPRKVFSAEVRPFVDLVGFGLVGLDRKLCSQSGLHLVSIRLLASWPRCYIPTMVIACLID